MCSYFEEHNCGENEEENQSIDLLLLARIFMENEGIIDMDMDIGSYSEEIKAPPASTKIIEKLPRKILKDTSLGKANCPVCLEKYESAEKYIELPCNHKFHEGCILSWLKQTNSCPVCRYELPTDNPEYEQIRFEKECQKQRAFRLETLHSGLFC